MRAILFSIGTRGDIEPFLAIAQVLNGKKWDVLCVFPEQFRETVESMGIPFKGFTKGFLELLDGEDAKMFMGGRGGMTWSEENNKNSTRRKSSISILLLLVHGHDDWYFIRNKK